MPYWSAHTHSRFSAKDALPTVSDIVKTVAGYGQHAVALTDHGHVSGIWQLYTAARKHGIMPFPGIEAYVATDRRASRPTTAHLGIIAYNNTGWDNLIGLNNLMMTNFRYKPLVDLNDLYLLRDQGLLEGLVATTGCWFGLVQRALDTGGHKAAMGTVKTLADIFGGRVYVEMQYHGIGDHNENEINDWLYAIAYAMGLPLVITSDSHYLHPGDKPAHNMLKRLGSWSQDDPDSAVFPGDGYHLCTEEEMMMRFSTGDEIAPLELFDAGVEGLGDLYRRNTLFVPELETFTTAVPHVVDRSGNYAGNDDMDYVLMHKCMDALEFNDAIPLISYEKYEQRLHHELGVITGAGFSGYILLTAKVTDYMRREGIMFTVRGSASGSLVNWLMGISDLDPVAFDLSFERFLSGDRAKPPDIDIDIEHSRREQVVEWLRSQYACMQIGTWRELKFSSESVDEDRGSLWVKWAMMCRKKGLDPNYVSDDDRELLFTLAGHRAFDGMGTGPAGLLVANDDSVLARVPWNYVASSKTIVTGPDKRDVEAAGYVKLDLLGLKTLTAIRISLEAAGVTLADIPWTDPQVYRRISRGHTEGMFQLSGYTANKGCLRLKPRNFEDLVASMALFRPAAMDSGATDEFIARKREKKQWDPHHKFIETRTKDTMGVLIYQEQLIEIFRDLGMGSDDLNATLKAVKASNSATEEARVIMSQTQEKVIALAGEAGMSEHDINWLINAMRAYAEYGFNRAHAVAYARLAFVTGWLAVHHPAAFWTGALTALSDDADRKPRLLRSAGEDKVRVLGAHVNFSGLDYTPVPFQPVIRKGLLSVDKVGINVANALLANAPYVSLIDIAQRCPRRIVTGSAALLKGHTPQACGGVIAALYNAGALEGLPLTHEEPVE